MLKLPGSPEDYHILVVDDEEMNRDMLSRRLERSGFRCTLAVDGTPPTSVTRKVAPTKARTTRWGGS